MDEVICRICLKISDIFTSLYFTIDKRMEKMLNVLCPSMDLEATPECSICESCLSNLEVSFNFKTNIIENEISISSWLNQNNVNIIDLSKLKKTDKAVDHICRLCLESTEDFIFLYEAEVDTTNCTLKQMCKEVFDVALIPAVKPIICNFCQLKLEVASKFHRSCINSDTMFKQYLKIHNSTDIDQEDFKNIIKFVDNNDYAIIMHNAETGLLKTEESITAKKNALEVNNNIKFEIACDENKLGFSGNEEVDCKIEIEEDIKLEFAEELNVQMEDEILTNGSYKCEKCNFQTPSKNVYINHMKESKDLICHHCTYSTHSKQRFQRHKQTHTQNYKTQYKCEKCSFKSHRKESMKAHQLVHSTLGMYKGHKCNQCSFMSLRKCSLREHMLVHAEPGTIPTFKCADCKFETKRKRALVSHFLIHASPDKIPMYQCEVCKFKTRTERNLERHMLSHAEGDEVIIYQCANCIYNTKRKNNLLSHMNVHRRYNFSCSECKYKAKTEKQLSDHKMKHLGPSFFCGNCQFSTANKNHLRVHMYKHTRKPPKMESLCLPAKS